MPRVVLVSPPFRSHAQPMSVLAGSLARAGVEAYLACAEPFADLASEAGVGFVPLTVTRNANTGVARRTEQGEREAARLEEFLESTRQGAVPALLTQARHRGEDMLADPETVLAAIRAVHQRLAPDWYVVDQLSYPVTLALHCLGLRFATFCPGHPSYLPHRPESLFGVPQNWPSSIRPAPEDLALLEEAARANDQSFTESFARTAGRHAPNRLAPGRAFALASPEAVVFNYLPFPWLPRRETPGRRYLYGGHCVPPVPSSPGHVWEGLVRRLRAEYQQLVLVALGTFLSARDDVLAALVRGIRAHRPDAAVIVAAGDRVSAMAGHADSAVHVAETVPQRWLLGRVDAMVHHGGNNSFTECLAAGVPAVVLPFSSDQFSIAHDLERAEVGLCLDPTRMTEEEAGTAVGTLLSRHPAGLARWKGTAGALGPDWTARRLLEAMGHRSEAGRRPGGVVSDAAR
ncbi:glycosyltransferase [Streptomyces sp. NPDC085614]|uniref:glycosyltransferase n=1 Tax=Streptomyces sp. NPDC085614 TaxID=3365733 RepID=UPI0037CF94BB